LKQFKKEIILSDLANSAGSKSHLISNSQIISIPNNFESRSMTSLKPVKYNQSVRHDDLNNTIMVDDILTRHHLSKKSMNSILFYLFT
jgi:hypothetical protein